jgi:uncharacterized membrane protein
MQLKHYYLLSVFSFSLLLIGQTLWIIALNPNTVLPKSISLILFVGPLLLALRGLLAPKLHTYKWITLFVWMYFCCGIWNVVEESQMPLGILQIVCSLSLYASAVLFVRAQRTS